MPKISVIVPVYNTKKYLDSCMRSIAHQTLEDLEIILVDDGSNDGSYDLCEEWKKKDSRILLIHQKNRGLGGARNTAMRKASGEFILFVDSDDWIDENCCEDLYNSAIDNQSDLVLMGETIFNEDKQNYEGSWRNYYGEKPAIVTKSNFVKCISPAWGRLYRTAFIRENELLFAEGIYYEDNSFGFLVSCLAKRISFSGNHYFYRQHKSSVTHRNDHTMIDLCSDFYYFNSLVNEKGLTETQIEWCYYWYIYVFSVYIKYIDNLTIEHRKTYLLLLKDIFNRMNFSRKTFFKNSIFDKNRTLEMFNFYKSMKNGVYQKKKSGFYFLNRILFLEYIREYAISQ